MVFVFTVLLVGLGAQLYSISYMQNDVRFFRFVVLLACFTVLIVLLVYIDGFWLFFAIWELIGLVSF